MAAPYRIVDARVERLGPSLRVHRRSAGATVVSLLLASSLLVPPFFVIADISSGTTESMTPSGFLFALFLACAAVSILVHVFRTRDLRIDVRTHGFVHRVRSIETGVPWEDVAAIVATVGIRHSARSGRFGYILTTRGGARIELPHTFEGMVELRSVLEKECVRHLLPVAVAELRAHRPVSFGRFIATHAGLSFDDRALPWSAVKGAAVVRGWLAVGDRGNGIGVLPKRDGIVAWAKAPYVDVPDGPVLLALMEHFKASARRAGDELEPVASRRTA